MIKRFKKIIVIFFLASSLISIKSVFAEELSFSSYLKNIQAGQVDDKGKCKNPCGSFTDNTKYQLSFGLPIAGLNKCSCVDVKAVPGIFVMALLQFLLASIGTVATILVIIAGFMWSFSAGNPETIKKARKMLTDAGIGMIVVIFSGSVLSIINPALLKIMTPNINTINYMCVDSIIAKSDNDGKSDIYVDKNNKSWRKNCDGTCLENYDCCTSSMIVCGKKCCTKIAGCNNAKDDCNPIQQKVETLSVGGSVTTITNADNIYTNTVCNCNTVGGSDPQSCIDNSKCKTNQFCGCSNFKRMSINGTASFIMICENVNNIKSYRCVDKKVADKACINALECSNGIKKTFSNGWGLISCICK